MNSTARIPTLDGWRGIAILLVVADHLNLNCHDPFPQLNWIGQQGVAIFFVLSGYLITTLLLAEYRKTGRIDLGAFYARRFLRLMPCAWLYLAVLAAAQAVTLPEAASCIFFFRNFATWANGAFTLHFWSLSIEEQFYLAWPTVLALAGVKRARLLAIIGAAAIAALRLATWRHYAALPVISSFATQLRADALLAGCAAALLPARLKFSPRATRWLLAVALVSIAACMFVFKIFIPLGESALIAFAIRTTATMQPGLLTAPFNLRPLAHIGVMSYSLYVWQEITLRVETPATFTATLIKLEILAALAFGSYYLVERPFVGLAHRRFRSVGRSPAAVARIQVVSAFWSVPGRAATSAPRRGSRRVRSRT